MASGGAAPEGRVAILFTDVEGSTRLWERAPEVARAALALHDALLRELLDVHHGYEVKTEGDAFMAAFGDARDAVRWCLAVQERLHGLPWSDELLARPEAADRGDLRGLRVRMGGHVGEAERRSDPRTGRSDWFGPMVNRAARVAAAGHGGQILLTRTLADEAQLAYGEARVELLGLYRFRDIDEDVEVVQVLPPSLASRRFPPIRTLPVTGNRPYRGLSSYEGGDAPLFRGRDREADELAATLLAHPLVTVTGPSGVGKSSLLRAGVIPRMPGHVACVMRPGVRPTRAIQGALADAPTDGRKRVLVVDQAEELLTQCDDEGEREAAAAALVALADGGDVRVVLVVREDFFARLGVLRALRGRFHRVVEVVVTPDGAQLEAALREPAAAFGYRFEDDALVRIIVDPIAGRPAAFALLSFIGDQLWDRRDVARRMLTWDAYRALGGTSGAIAAHSDRAFDAIPAANQPLARAVLLALVASDGTRASVPERALPGAGRPETLAAVLEHLGRARIVVRADRTEPVVELAHEAVIRHWPRLRAWLAQDVEAHQLREVLRGAADQWDRRGRPAELLWSAGLVADLERLADRLTDLTPLERAFADRSAAVLRNRIRARRTALGGALAATGILAAVLAGLWYRADRALARSEAAEAESRAALDAQELALLRTSSALARNQGDDSAGLAYLRSAARLAAQRGPIPADLVAELQRVLYGPAHRSEITLDGLRGLELLPGGREIAAIRTTGVTIVDLATGAARVTLPAPEGMEPGLTSASQLVGTRLLTRWVGDGTSTTVVWDLATGRALGERSVGPEADREASVLSPDGAWVGMTHTPSDAPPRLVAWPVESGGGRGGFEVELGPLYDGRAPRISFCPGSDRVVTHVLGHPPRMWDLTGAPIPLPITDAALDVACVAGTRLVGVVARGPELAVVTWGADGRADVLATAPGPAIEDEVIVADGDRLAAQLGTRVLVGAPDGDRWAFTELPGGCGIPALGPKLTADGCAGEIRLRRRPDAPPVPLMLGAGQFQLRMTPEGDLVATASPDGGLRVWHDGLDGVPLPARARRLVATAAGPVALQKDWPRFVADGALQPADVDALPPDARPTGQGCEIVAADDGAVVGAWVERCSSNHGNTFAMGGRGVTIAEWRPGAPSRVVWTSPTELATAVALAPGPTWALAPGTLPPHDPADGPADAEPDPADPCARVWRPGATEPVRLCGGPDRALQLALTRDGRYLAADGDDGTWLWSVDDASLVTRLPEGWSAFTGDGDALVVAADDALLVQPVAGGAPRRLPGADLDLAALAVARHRDRVVAATRAPSGLVVWDLDGGEPRRVTLGAPAISQLKITDDGARIAFLADDRPVVYDAGTLLPILDVGPRWPGGAAEKLAFSTDGAQLFASYGPWMEALPTPATDADALLRAADGATNLRVCQDSRKVVAVTPWPADDAVWAPPDRCPL